MRLRIIKYIIFFLLLATNLLAMVKDNKKNDSELSFLLYDVIHNVERAAEDIYLNDVQNFLQVKSSALVLSVIYDVLIDVDARRFIKGIDILARKVQDTFFAFTDKEKLAKNWVTIALILYERRDFYGYASILYGLYASKDHFNNVNLKQLFSLVKEEIYLPLKIVSAGAGMIPLIFRELITLNKALSDTREIQKGEFSSSITKEMIIAMKKFKEEIKYMQNALRQNIKLLPLSSTMQMTKMIKIESKKMGDKDYSEISDTIKEMLYAPFY